MTSAWQTKPFEDCIERVSYSSKIQRSDFLDVGRYPIISQEDAFINGYWNSEADVFTVKKPVVIFGDHTKALKFVDFDFVLGADGVKILQPKEFLLPKFFFYQLQTADLDSLGYARHYRLLKALNVRYPDSAEQRRIVGIIDEAFAGIAVAKAHAEQNRRKASALFDSALETVFARGNEEWEDAGKPLVDLCDLVVDCEHKTAPTQDQGIPSIRTPNIGKGRLLLNGVNRVSEATYREWTRRAEPQPGDLILAREAPAGNVAVIPENLKVCLGQRTVLIRPSRQVFEPQFLALLVLQPQVQARLLAHSRGATVQHVNMKDIRALRVGRVPSLLVQREIIAKFDEIMKNGQHLESLYTRKLAALDELKKSLLHQAFSGAL
jgi:type I restriction enzyme S subunit